MNIFLRKSVVVICSVALAFSLMSVAFAYDQGGSLLSQDISISLEDMERQADGSYKMTVPLSLYSSEDIGLSGSGISDVAGDYDVILLASYSPRLSQLVTSVYVKRFAGAGVVISANAEFAYTVYEGGKFISSGRSVAVTNADQHLTSLTVTETFRDVKFDEASDTITIAASGEVRALGNIGGNYSVVGTRVPKL